MNFNKLKSQSGRSMVEMLGVLAIIGVLSVGGIAGYSLSMRRHRANGVVDTISKYASLGYARCQQLIVNGELTTFAGCESHMQAFDDTDIGVMPAGVSSILFLGAWENEKADTTKIRVKFSDPKLCAAVVSITGTSYSSTGSVGCNSADPVFDIEIKQN